MSAASLPVAQALGEYIPYLLGIFNGMLTDELIVRRDFVFAWQPTVSRSRRPGTTMIESANIYLEVYFTLMTYAAALGNHAAALVQSLGVYELDSGQSSASRHESEEQLKHAADHLCRAAGVFEYVGGRVLPQWQQHGEQLEPPTVEVTSEVVMALAKLAMADAHTLAVRRLVSNPAAIAHDTLTPGPPLPPGHPSPSLLAKLHLYAAALYQDALALLAAADGQRRAPNSQAPGEDAQKSSAARGVGKLVPLEKLRSKLASVGVEHRISSSLLQYLEREAHWQRAVAYKWLGIDAGESSGRTGEALAFLAAAGDMMSRFQPRDAASKAPKPPFTKQARLLRHRGSDSPQWVELEIASVRRIHSLYQRMNDTVSFQRVPSLAELELGMPSGRAALAPKPYNPPAPVFGPGSSRVSPGLETESLLLGVSSGRPSRGEYSGAGAYY